MNKTVAGLQFREQILHKEREDNSFITPLLHFITPIIKAVACGKHTGALKI
jgi:hypothetical protein